MEKVVLKDKLVSVNRITKVVKGGRRFAFSALVVVGNFEGSIGVGHGKAKQVPDAIKKATQSAKNNLFKIPLKEAKELEKNLIKLTLIDLDYLYFDPQKTYLLKL